MIECKIKVLGDGVTAYDVEVKDIDGKAILSSREVLYVGFDHVGGYADWRARCEAQQYREASEDVFIELLKAYRIEFKRIVESGADVWAEIYASYRLKTPLNTVRDWVAVFAHYQDAERVQDFFK